jgi:hypothetical protein
MGPWFFYVQNVRCYGMGPYSVLYWIYAHIAWAHNMFIYRMYAVIAWAHGLTMYWMYAYIAWAHNMFIY